MQSQDDIEALQVALNTDLITQSVVLFWIIVWAIIVLSIY